MDITIEIKLSDRDRALLGELLLHFETLATRSTQIGEQMAEINRKFTKAIDVADNATRAIDGIRPAIEGLQLGGATR